jgi:hypothetical protein
MRAGQISLQGRHIQQWPRKRLMDPGPLDASLVYLPSDVSAYVTRSVFSIDDGRTL